jgi:hypothetical protein
MAARRLIGPRGRSRLAAAARRACLIYTLCAAWALGSPAVRGQPPPDPKELFQQLNHLAIDPSQIYVLRNAQISRDRVNFYFDRGFIGFLTRAGGEITGALFEGDGEILLIPPNPVEKKSLVSFIQSPILEERFRSVYLRFTDQTAKELIAQARRPDPDDFEQPTGFVERWDPVMRELDPAYTMRILMDLLGDRTLPYFHAQIAGVNLGAFQVDVDERLPEAVRVGIVRRREGGIFNDFWCSFASRASQAHESSLFEIPARVKSYRIDTHISPDDSLTGHAELELESTSNADRALPFELARMLKVAGVKDGEGRALTLFQNLSEEESEVATRGNDYVLVVLPAPIPAEKRYHLSFDYQGGVITAVGNGVFYVGAHGSWYPNRGREAPATYDLTFHYPDHVTLVATGHRVEENSADGWKHSHWVSLNPIPVAGFNLGAYVSRTRRVGKATIEVYATREVEAPLETRHAATQPSADIALRRSADGSMTVEIIPKAVTPLDPAALLDGIAQKVADDVAYFSTLFGPFPYSHLSISQAPGHYGQGWPGLVYQPSLSFLTETQRRDLGFAQGTQELEVQLAIAHEIAHQWWGNEVGWETYHDQWLSEGFATYAAALDLTRQKDGDLKFHDLLQGYRQDLLRKTKQGNTVESGGPIWLGQRLSNSLNPDGYASIIYKKSCWVIHMLRALMRDPSTGSDERFFKMLRDFVVAYRSKMASTEDFIHHTEKYMTPAMDVEHNHRLDWFFADWVYGTGIPTYQLDVSTRRIASKEFVIEGTIEQRDVPPEFDMLVPLVAVYGRGTKDNLGLVTVTSTGGRFQFTTTAEPVRVTIDTDSILAVVH